MDRLTAQRMLSLAERHIITGKAQVARQLRVIARLKIAGYDTRLARRTLERLRETLDGRVRHRDQLRHELHAFLELKPLRRSPATQAEATDGMDDLFSTEPGPDFDPPSEIPER